MAMRCGRCRARAWASRRPSPWTTCVPCCSRSGAVGNRPALAVRQRARTGRLVRRQCLGRRKVADPGPLQCAVDLRALPVSDLVFRFATVQGQAIHWFLGRNCSVTPAQLGWLYASLCLVTLGIGTFFWVQGAVMVL